MEIYRGKLKTKTKGKQIKQQRKGEKRGRLNYERRQIIKYAKVLKNSKN